MYQKLADTNNFLFDFIGWFQSNFPADIYKQFIM